MAKVVKTIFKDAFAPQPGKDSDHNSPKYAEGDLNDPKVVIGVGIKDEPSDLFPLNAEFLR